jgi:hypothetical protein
MHAEHREAQWEHREWLEDIARWREEHHRATAMLLAIKEAWDKAEVALEAHVQQIRAHEEHLHRHEQQIQQQGWTMGDVEDDSSLAEHRKHEVAHAAARKAHEKLMEMHYGVMTEVLELLKVTHPGAVALETG